MSIWDDIQEMNGGTITNDVENYKVLENGTKAKEVSYDMTLEIFLDNAMKRDKVEIRNFVWCLERTELPEVILTASSSTFAGDLWMNGELIGPLSKKSLDIRVLNNADGSFRLKLWIDNLVKEFYQDEIKEDNKLLGKQYNTTLADDELNSFGKYSRQGQNFSNTILKIVSLKYLYSKLRDTAIFAAYRHFSDHYTYDIFGTQIWTKIPLDKYSKNKEAFGQSLYAGQNATDFMVLNDFYKKLLNNEYQNFDLEQSKKNNTKRASYIKR